MLNGLAISYELYMALSIVCLVLSLIAAIFVIIVVIMQPSNSSGINAISGQSETFYSKNKGKTWSSKMKKLTVIAIAILAVCMIAFYIVHLLPVA